MNPCARGCCWNPWNACSRQRVCDCHWGEAAPSRVVGGADATYRDPTAVEAIYNIMNQGRKPR